MSMSREKQVVECAGSDVDAAVAAGLARLDLPRDAVEVEVLDEGRQGMFGLGARAARVRLRVTSETAGKAEAEPAAPAPPPPASTAPSVEAPSPEAPPAEAPSRAEEAIEREVIPDEPAEAGAEEPELTERDKIKGAREVMQGLLKAMHLGAARVEVERAEPGPNEEEVPPLVIDVSGPRTDVLIGTDGQVLDDFQYITRLLVGRSMKSWVHVVVDVQGFKAKRADRLRDLAHRMADQAADTDRAVILQPMPPHERRVVHVALYDDPRVTTESIYEGERRRVTILPKE